MIIMSRIVLTGANGVVGRATLKKLRRSGYEVVATDINTNKKLKIEKLDVRDFSEVLSSFKSWQPIDAVIHLAALVAGPPSEKRPWDYIHTNVMGTLNILEAMRMTNTPKLIQLSSWSLYGSNIPLPINESTPINPKNPYAVSKVMIEKEVKLYCDLYGLKGVVLRPTMIYGVEQREKNIVQQVVDCMETGETFEIWGSGEHTRELLSAEDMADVIEKSIDYEPENGYEMFVVGTENPLSVVDVAKAGRMISDFKIKFVPSNKWVFSQRSDMKKIKKKMKIDPLKFKKISTGLLECLLHRTNPRKEY